jgi:virginiamycin B lyase
VNSFGVSGLFLVAASVLLGQNPAPAPPITASITEFPLPTTGNFPDQCSSGNAAPLRIAAGPDGALWFTESNSNKIGRIATSGSITEYCIPTPSATPQGITAGPDGALWFIEAGANNVGRIDAASHAITEFPIPTANSQPEEIVTGPDGSLWITESINAIGRITVAGKITQFTRNSGSSPSAITAGPDGNLWFTTSDIWKITTAGVSTEISATQVNLDTPSWIAPGPDGALWYVGQNSNNINSVSTAGVVNVSAAIPTTQSSPFAIVAGGDGALWFTEAGGNKIGRITTGGIITNEFAVPTGGAAPLGIAAGSDGALWFVESGANQIGRLVLTTPVIQSGGILNGATNQPGVVAGSWVSIYGDGFSSVSTDWSSASFANGLPTSLGKVQVTFNGQAAATYYVSPTQLNVQAPSNISGNVSVEVTNNNITGAAVEVNAVQSAPGLFAYTLDSKTYPSAVYPDGVIVGDPSVAPGVRKANVGDVIELYATGLGPSPGGALIPTAVPFAAPVTVFIGSTQVTASFAGLVFPGEFQINFTVPDLPAGNYPLTIQTGGISSQAGVILPMAN